MLALHRLNRQLISHIGNQYFFTFPINTVSKGLVTDVLADEYTCSTFRLELRFVRGSHETLRASTSSSGTG